MFMQKFKASLRFLGILLLRVSLGIVVGYLWLLRRFAFRVAYLFHIIMDVYDSLAIHSIILATIQDPPGRDATGVEQGRSTVLLCKLD